MTRVSLFAIPFALAMSAASAHAATTIVNLNAAVPNPNAGHSSPGYTYNPVNVQLGAGTYKVQVVGIAGGGLYDAYAVYAPTPTNLAYTDSNWAVDLNNGTGPAYTQSTAPGRSNTAAGALALYSPASYTFTLNSAQTVSFYVDDTAQPFFGDNSGGLSLAVSSVPEPASLALLGAGLVGLVATQRRRRKAAV